MATMQQRPAYRQSSFPGRIQLKQDSPQRQREEGEQENRQPIQSMLQGASTRGPSEPTPEEVGSGYEDEDELVSFVGAGGRQEQFRSSGRRQQAAGVEESNRLTKSGKPDRRFKGQRELPEEEVVNPHYRRANIGTVIDGVHLTTQGAPDRRFKENRNISDEDAEVLKAQLILAKYQGRTGTDRH